MAIIRTRKFLARRQPRGTSVAVLYSPESNVSTEVRSILVTNTTSSAANFSIYYNSAGGTPRDGDLLYCSNVVSANVTTKLSFSEGEFTMSASSTLGVKGSAADAIIFSAFGVEEKRQ